MDDRRSNFLKFRSIETNIQLNVYLDNAIDRLEYAHELVRANVSAQLDRLADVPEWSVVHDMYLKCYENTSGALTSLVTANLSSAEALCRVAIESSINLSYIAQKDTINRVFGYIKNYIEKEKKENRQWRDSLRDIPNTPEKTETMQLIMDKDMVLDKYAEILRGSFRLIGVDYDVIGSDWPKSVYDRFLAVGKEVEYRTVYAALCTQVHNDAEDILNNLVSRVVLIEGIEEAIKSEQYVFAVGMTLTSIYYFIESAMHYGECYNMPTAKQLIPLFQAGQADATLVFKEIPRLTLGKISFPSGNE